MYTVDYFIAKFTNTREDKWCTDWLQMDGKSCANGWCGVTSDAKYRYVNDESTALANIFSVLEYGNIRDVHKGYSIIAAYINNGNHPLYLQDHPKKRILAALNDIKRMQLNEQYASNQPMLINPTQLLNTKVSKP